MWTFYSATGEAMIQDGAMTIANNTNNRVVTATGAEPASLNGEANLTFDGTTLTIPGQIAFPATQSASANVNTLDDYEEGTWPPSFTDQSASASENQGYGNRIGTYTKIGKQVTFNMNLIISNLGCLATCQRALIIGLPVTSGSSIATGNVHVGFAQSLNITAGHSVTGIVNSCGTQVTQYLWDGTAGPSLFLVSELSTGGGIELTGHYIAAA